MVDRSIQPSTNQARFAVLGLVAGVILGYPLSYFFQPAALRAKLSLGQYIKHFSDVIGSKELQSSVIAGFVVAILVCGAIGFWMGRAKDQK